MIGKYVVTNKEAILIPMITTHADVIVVGSQIESAGFYCIEGNNILVYGESISLGVKSRPEDEEVIRKCFFSN